MSNKNWDRIWLFVMIDCVIILIVLAYELVLPGKWKPKLVDVSLVTMEQMVILEDSDESYLAPKGSIIIVTGNLELSKKDLSSNEDFTQVYETILIKSDYYVVGSGMVILNPPDLPLRVNGTYVINNSFGSKCSASKGSMAINFRAACEYQSWLYFYPGTLIYNQTEDGLMVRTLSNAYEACLLNEDSEISSYDALVISGVTKIIE